MTGNSRAQDWSSKRLTRPLKPSRKVETVVDEELEILHQQQFRQFREALSPFWAWRMPHR